MTKIVVIGSSNTDMVIQTDRFPVPGETVSGGEFLMTAGGKGANQAVAAVRLGARVTFVAKVGDDLFGQQAVAGFEKDRINTEFVSVAAGMASGVASILINEHGENCIAVAPGANALLSPEDVECAAGVIEESDVLLMQLETPLATVEYAAALGHRLGKIVILNPAPAQLLPAALLANLDVIIPNETEVELLSGIQVIDEESMAQAAQILRAQGVGAVIITLGSQGAYIQTENRSKIIPTEELQVVDTTAAGDTFNGALAVGLAKGWGIEESVIFANKAASIAVTRIGAQQSAPYLDELCCGVESPLLESLRKQDCCMSTRNHSKKIRLLIDTDANNETDDQHAIAYALFSNDVFDVEGITVNRTHKGGDVDMQMEEAIRIVKLCGFHPGIPMRKGANANLKDILPHLDSPDFDGHEAVDFIIQQALKSSTSKLVLLPIGKLTNIALALAKEPAIIPNVRVVWLGSNFPATDDQEYNLTSDPDAVQFLLDCPVDFEIVTVLFGDPKGTWGLKVSQEEVFRIMPGVGPFIDDPIVGRHGGEFFCFGDYSVNLFDNSPQHGDPPGRPLFDVGAVAVVKNPAWARPTLTPRPSLVNGGWELRPENPMKMVIWDHFDRDAIVSDFFEMMKNDPVAASVGEQVFSC